MDTKTIIKQLEKALSCKEDKEMRLRVEVLVDMLKEIPEPLRQPVSLPSQSPITPLPTYYESTPPLTAQPTVSTPKKQPKINGAGAISSANSEQITYTRPKGT